MSPEETCSALSRARDEPMFATGSQVSGWLMIEVRGAWGQDAIHESPLGAHVPEHWKDDLRRRHIRAVAIRSHRRAGETEVRLFACTARRPGSRPATLWTRDLASLADVVAAVGELAVDRRPPSAWVEDAGPLLLVCTNGRHDQCCAIRGRPLVRALRDSPWDDRLWECSHIGGDRFAPNLVVLPDSIYFGRVEPEVAPALLTALDAGRLDLQRFRGRTAYSLAEQAVEHFVRRELGIDALDGVAVEGRADDGSFAVQLRDRRVHVTIRSRMVTIPDALTCDGRPGQLVPTFTLESIT